MFPAIFLDRDGVLIENRADYIREWSHVKVIPGAIEALSHPALAGYRIVIVTNQSAVGRGLLSLETAGAINARFLDLIRARGGRLDALFMCHHAPADECPCRKPKPGLLLRAAQELGLDLSRSWMIGDAWSDVLAGQAARVRQAVLLRTGRGMEQLAAPRPAGLRDHLVLDDLAAAFDALSAQDAIPPQAKRT